MSKTPISDAIAVRKGKVATSETQELAEAPSEQPEVKEPVATEELDEKGVSFKNRFMEAERKRKQLEEELNTLRASATRSEAEQEATDTDLSEDFQSTTMADIDPYATVGRPVKAPADKQADKQVDDDDTGFATTRQVSAIMNQVLAKRSNDSLAFQKFPDLGKPKSELSSEVRRRLQVKRSLGFDVDNDPLVLYETAAAAYGDLVVSGRIIPNSRQRDEQTRREAVDGGSLPGAPALAPKLNTDELTSSQKNMIETFRRLGINVTEDGYKKHRG